MAALPDPSQLPPWLAQRLRQALHSDDPDGSELFGVLLSYFRGFFTTAQRFMLYNQYHVRPELMGLDPNADTREEEALLFLPFVDQGRARASRIPSGVHPAQLTPSRYPYGTWKSPDLMVVKAGDNPWTDTIVLIAEVRRANADADKARGELCAYMEAAAGRGLASPHMRGMLILQSTFDIFEVVDGKAALVRSGLEMCGAGCNDFLASVANEHA